MAAVEKFEVEGGPGGREEAVRWRLTAVEVPVGLVVVELAPGPILLVVALLDSAGVLDNAEDHADELRSYTSSVVVGKSLDGLELTLLALQTAY